MRPERTASARGRWAGLARAHAPVLAAVAIIAAILAANILVSSDRVALTSLMIAAPLLCGLTVSVSETLAVGALAMAAAVSVFVWDTDLGSWRRWVPLAVVTIATGFAAVTALYRQRLRRNADRIRDLAVVAGLAEEQLQVILAAVDAAVTVRDRAGQMVYANQAAADLLTFRDPAAVVASAPGDSMGRFEVYTEDGDPLDLADMPGTRLLRGEPAPPAVVVRNVVKATGEERWLLNKARGVTGPDGRIELAVNLIEDVTETKRTEIAQRLLAHSARTIGEASDLDRALQELAEAAVPSLADWAAAHLLEDGRRIRTCALAHRDGERLSLGRRLRAEWPAEFDEPAGIGAVVRTGMPHLVHDIDEDQLRLLARDSAHLTSLRKIGLNSLMVTPIQSGDRILGALSFVSSTSRRFDERDLELACDLGRQIGLAIDRAELHAEQSYIARTLQAGLIPSSLPSVDGWELASAYRAAGRANAVGGDFYDVIAVPDGWVAIIGDVVGKGAEAAALTAVARHTLAAILESTGAVDQALWALNRRLGHRRGHHPNLCTVCAVHIAFDDTVTIVSAGHPLPVLRRGNRVSTVGAPSPMLGFLDDVEIVPTRLEPVPGDQLVLYTDGVLDAIGSLGRFGEKRLMQTVARLPEGEAAAGAILAAIDRFMDATQADDIAILSLTRAPVPAAQPAAVGPDQL